MQTAVNNLLIAYQSHCFPYNLRPAPWELCLSSEPHPKHHLLLVQRSCLHYILMLLLIIQSNCGACISFTRNIKLCQWTILAKPLANRFHWRLVNFCSCSHPVCGKIYQRCWFNLLSSSPIRLSSVSVTFVVNTSASILALSSPILFSVHDKEQVMVVGGYLARNDKHNSTICYHWSHWYVLFQSLK